VDDFHYLTLLCGGWTGSRLKRRFGFVYSIIA
jgi:hypothetical protein